ncbi:hypothetical protein [Streptomyces altiplanensis]
MLPEPFPDGHAVDTGPAGEPGFGGVAWVDTGDGDLWESGEGPRFRGAVRVTASSEFRGEAVGVLTHQPVRGCQRLPRFRLIVGIEVTLLDLVGVVEF